MEGAKKLQGAVSKNRILMQLNDEGDMGTAISFDLSDFVKNKKRKKKKRNKLTRLQLLRSTFEKFRTRIREQAIQNKLFIQSISMQQLEDAERVSSTRDAQYDANGGTLLEAFDPLSEWEIVNQEHVIPNVSQNYWRLRGLWTIVN